MCARDGDEQVLRVDVAKTGYVGGERFAIRPFGVGIDVVLNGGAGGFGGVEEF